MRVGGAYVGLGIGDSSEEVRKIKAHMRRKFSYAKDLVDTTLYDEQMVTIVAEMQRRYVYAGKLRTDGFMVGVINLATKVAMGYANPPVKPRPIIFTIEGHMSNPWNGPCAYTAQALEEQGVAWWQPVNYDTVRLPFNNQSGIDEFCRLLSLTELDDGRGGKRPFPAGTPFGYMHFSQGAIVGSRTYLEHLRPENGKLHWRLKDLKRVIAAGNPYREKGVVAEWIADPPKPNTQGISNVRMDNTPAFWKEVARKGDLYTENTEDDAGEDKTAIYMAVQNQWWGHNDSLFNQLSELIKRPLVEGIAMFKAITSGVMFLGNMGPHGMYDLDPWINWMRGVAD